jgi:phosphate starvation-inducible protein PhoH and related proteins
MARRQLEVSNEVAAELAGSRDAGLRTLQEHLDCEVYLRGNVVTLDGEAEAVQAGATVVRELSSLVERGHDIGPATIESVARVLESAESPATVLEDVVWRHRNLRVAPKSVNQKRYVDAIRRSTVTFGVGPAGTGKTFLAMAMAVAELTRNNYARIVLTRPAVEAGEKLGFLPGDLAEKVNPYLRPLYDALHDMVDFDRARKMIERGTIEVAPLAFMRGRTLNDSFVILDEAQNTTNEQMKMFLTRLGYGSKAVVTGDVTQIDLPAGKSSGLKHAVSILGDIPGIRFVYFNEKDVVRHRLVQDIICAYERAGAVEAAAQGGGANGSPRVGNGIREGDRPAAARSEGEDRS